MLLWAYKVCIIQFINSLILKNKILKEVEGIKETVEVESYRNIGQKDVSRRVVSLI